MPIRLTHIAAAAAFLLAAVAVATPSAPAFAAERDPSEFIVDLGERAVGALTDKSLTAETRRERFRDLLRVGLDMEHIGQFVLGAYRRRTSDDQMATFLDLLEDNIVQNYAWRFRNYNGQKLDVLGVREGGRGNTLVETELSQAGDAPPIRVDWRIHEKNGEWRVIDIVVEGISMMVTQRDEYVGYMRSNGGVDALLKALRKQNESLADRQDG